MTLGHCLHAVVSTTSTILVTELVLSTCGFFFFFKRCSRIILPVQQNQFLLNDSESNGWAVNIQSSREGTLHYWGVMVGSVEKKGNLFMPLDVSLQ